MNIIINSILTSIIIVIALTLIGYLMGVIKKYITKFLGKIVGRNLALVFVNRITFIGTVIHELSHALFATLSGAQVTKVKLLEFRGNTLGSVEYIPRGNFITKSVQHTLSAYAPVVCGILLEWLLIFKVGYSSNIWVNILKIYAMLSILLHMTMSKQDIKMCLKGLPICILLITSITYIFRLDIVLNQIITI